MTKARDRGREDFEKMQEEWKKWEALVSTCRCRKPVKDRRYLGEWTCRRCGKPMVS